MAFASFHDVSTPSMAYDFRFQAIRVTDNSEQEVSMKCTQSTLMSWEELTVANYCVFLYNPIPPVSSI